MKKIITIFFIIFCVSFSFRWQRIHVPFWVDEFSSANQALLLQRYSWNFFSHSDHYVELRSLITTGLISLSFSLLGVSEKSARLPIEIVGSCVPFLIYFLCKILIPEKRSVRINATLFSITSYFLITWSRQARGYSIQIFSLLLAMIAYNLFLNYENKKKKVVWLVVTFVALFLGIFAHPTFLIVVFCLATHFLFLYRKESWLVFKVPMFKIVITASTVVLFFVLLFTGFVGQVSAQVQFIFKNGLHNNIWYYHSFLWREYGLITFLGTIGLVFLALQNFKKNVLILGIILCYLLFICFLFPAVDSRYLLPIFPFLLIGMAISIDLIITSLFLTHKNLVIIKGLIGLFSVGCTLLIIINGYKFDIKPNSFYSVDHDFREIALIDYDQVYSIIKQKGDLAAGKTAVIDTWPDRLEWYLGLDFQPNYVFRWEDAGFMRQTPFSLQPNGDKVLKQRVQTKLISTEQDLKRVLSLYPKGFIWIDDTTLPADVIAYAKTHFKQELYLDHYPLDDNPYSIWPGTLYSWGY